MQLQNEFVSEPAPPPQSCGHREVIAFFSEAPIRTTPSRGKADDSLRASAAKGDRSKFIPPLRESDALEITRRFLRIADFENAAFERLGRYESSLWRQARQTIFTLEALRWRAWRTRDCWHRAARGCSDAL